MENPPRKRVLEIARDLIIERCLIHGLPHIVDSKKSLWIRIFWGFLLFISLGLYFYFLFLISFKFFINPDISLSFGHRPIRELPFPAVTICSPLISHDLNQNFTDLTAIPQWCDIEASLKSQKTTKGLRNQELIKEMEVSQQKLDDFLSDCSYRTKPIDCSKIFTRVLTEFGYCFTYNMQDHHAIFNEEISKDFDGYKKEEVEKIQWTLDNGYNTDSEIVKPKKADKPEEIVFSLQIPFNFDRLCPTFDSTFKIFLHLPNELILQQKPDSIDFGFYYEKCIVPKTFSIKEEVKRYSPKIRNCYLKGEKKLKFFKQYTENMCRLECLTNITLKECKCVKFSMPRDDETRVCVSYEKVQCMIQIKKTWTSKVAKCDCLRTCNYVEYSLRTIDEAILNESLNDEGKLNMDSKRHPISQVKLRIFHLENQEEMKTCSYDLINYIIDFAGLTTLFTGCSITSLLELAFFIVERRRRQGGEEITQTESSLDEFVQSSSIEGAKCFHSSESKFVKIFWIFIFFLSFNGLGFYTSEIYSKCKLKSIIATEENQLASREIPFPAVTTCVSIFSRNLKLDKILENPVMNLTIDQQNELAANLQSCNPNLVSDFKRLLSQTDSQKIISYMRKKMLDINKEIIGCSYQLEESSCSKIWNDVLTDYGFCYTFNLEGFSTLFNTEVISDDFKCYKRDKLAKNYYQRHSDYNKTKDDSNQSIHWMLGKGYLNKNDQNISPVPMIKSNVLQSAFNITHNISNSCPELGSSFSFFLHMPNEILTPFHVPYHVSSGVQFTLTAKVFKTNENLRPYPPKIRACYFEGERALKFFKSYTKAHCEFECLTNFTLDVCGCVKFSMPRENSTTICGINQITCYVEAMRNWSSRVESKCDCLHPCTYIEYSDEGITKEISRGPHLGHLMIFVKKDFFDQVLRSSSYGFENGLADFGGMLGVFFGASVISFIEIFYFCFIALIKKKFNIKVESSGFSLIAQESTIHGIPLIFKPNIKNIVRGFWTITFFLTLSYAIFYARENYKKFAIYSQTSLKQNQKSIEEIPFPAVTFRSPLFAKANLTMNYDEFYKMTYNNQSLVNVLNYEQFKYYLANSWWSETNVVSHYVSYWNHFVKKVSNPDNYRSNVDLVPYLNRSQMEIDEYFYKCEIGGEKINCSKIFRRILTLYGICYSFNMQSFHSIFNKEISKNFDSYGRYEEEKDSQWSLDQGFKVQNSNNPVNPIKANVEKEVTFHIIFPLNHLQNAESYFHRFSVHSPGEITEEPHLSLGTNLATTLKINILSTRSNENLKRFKPRNRNCYFENERKLQFFKTYTKSHCEFECLTNLTIKTCGCVTFIQIYSDSMPICDTPIEIRCSQNLRNEFPSTFESAPPCGCLKTCNRIEYNVEEIYKKGKPSDQEISQLTLRFVESQYLETENFVSYGFLSFIADVGGLLGLFLGCSMLSFFELIYYPTKFIVEKIKKRKNQVDPKNQEIVGSGRNHHLDSIQSSKLDNPEVELNQEKYEINDNQHQNTQNQSQVLKNPEETETTPNNQLIEEKEDEKELESSLKYEIEHENFLKFLMEFEKELENE